MNTRLKGGYGMDHRPVTHGGVNALKRKHPRGRATLPGAALSSPGRVLATALLADTLPAVPERRPAPRVTASLAMRWAHPVDQAAPVAGRFERVRGLAPYIGVNGRITDGHGALVASSFALFAGLPADASTRRTAHPGVPAAGLPAASWESAGPAVIDAAGEAMAAAIATGAVTDQASGRELVVTVDIAPEWLNKLDILHGASGTALLVMAACRLVADGGPWPRVADLYLRFLQPVRSPTVVIRARLVRQSPRSIDVEVILESASAPALTGRLLLAAPLTR